MVKYQLLVKGDHVGMVFEDWLHNGKCNLTLRKDKINGCRVIETSDPLFADRVLNYLRATEKVNIIQVK